MSTANYFMDTIAAKPGELSLGISSGVLFECFDAGCQRGGAFKIGIKLLVADALHGGGILWHFL